MTKRNNTILKEKPCYFCTSGIKEVDYRNLQVLQKFISSYNKIVPKRRSGLCATHQRKMARAIKRARIMGLVPFVPR